MNTPQTDVDGIAIYEWNVSDIESKSSNLSKEDVQVTISVVCPNTKMSYHSHNVVVSLPRKYVNEGLLLNSKSSSYRYDKFN